jgi:hypothetical protein
VYKAIIYIWPPVGQCEICYLTRNKISNPGRLYISGWTLRSTLDICLHLTSSRASVSIFNVLSRTLVSIFNVLSRTLVSIFNVLSRTLGCSLHPPLTLSGMVTTRLIRDWSGIHKGLVRDSQGIGQGFTRDWSCIFFL